ncbi:hypothetical protein BDW02DRAFT_499367 [Decorospora gaudefroyi]|uniref:PSI domain-containing protein n=1 Tax=Decorospora gaudefroyi TaxID=184978 RepID=A0A6A5K808_9PLEO|nr:hypothetical protein BDW02DRAFT_499367 [Decorospora gaudefroyi]
MPSSCPIVPNKHNDGVSFNVTEWIQSRYLDNPKEDWERLRKCWGFDDCGDCQRADGHCGWCAISSTCLPLPIDPLSRAFPLLTPIRYKSICALRSERFELRTSGLGCQVSTITFLTSIVTIFCTLFGVLVLYSLAKCVKWAGRGIRGSKGGYVIREGGSGEVWVRSSEGWTKWWHRTRGKQTDSEVKAMDEGTRKRGSSWWNTRERAAERRPLLA